MSQFYTREREASDPWKLPNAEVFELTSREVAEMDGELIREYMRKPEFRLAAMNNRVQEAMFQAMIDDEAISGGWFYRYCYPGCMPESEPFGPYASRQEAIDAARDSEDEDC